MKSFTYWLGIGIMLIVIPLMSNGQMATYQPFLHSSPDASHELKEIERRFEKDKSLLRGISGSSTQAIIEVYEERATKIQTLIQEGSLLFDPQLTSLIDRISGPIFEANPTIPASEIRIWISRYPWPNASCLGEGTILLNMGLIERLENESQLAFVICHELAHYMMNHVNHAISERIGFLFARSTQKELKQIAKSEYNQLDRLKELLGETLYNDRKHGRSNELEADSMALEYLKRTEYDSYQAITTLALLDKIDQDTTDTTLDLQSVFNFPEIPFEPSWLETESDEFVSGTSYNLFEADSLKTHPDCANRIQKLLPSIKPTQAASVRINSDEFAEIRKRIAFEKVEFYFHSQNYGMCLRNALMLRTNHPKNAYVLSRISVCLSALYEARQHHEFGKFVDLPDQQQPSHYRTVLTFLHNLRMSELKKLSQAFIQSYQSQLDRDEHFLYAMIRNAHIQESPAENTLVQLYQERFPNGRYLHSLGK